MKNFNYSLSHIWIPLGLVIITMGSIAFAQHTRGKDIYDELLGSLQLKLKERFTGKAGHVGVVPLSRPEDDNIRDMNYPYYYRPNGCSTSAITKGNLRPDEEYESNISKLSTYIDFKQACNNHDICYQTAGAEYNTCNLRFAQDLVRSCTDRFTDLHKPIKTLLNWINPVGARQLPLCLYLAKRVAETVELAAVFKIAFVGSQENVFKTLVYARDMSESYGEFTYEAANSILSAGPLTPEGEAAANHYLRLSESAYNTAIELEVKIESQAKHVERIKKKLL